MRSTENDADMELKLCLCKKYQVNRNSVFRLLMTQVCRFVKWFERRLTLKIDQVTMSEVVEVSVRQWVYIVKKKAEKA